MQSRANHPILDFGIEKFTLRYAGSDLQPQKCILAERNGTSWSANACGGVMQIRPDGSQTLITQKHSYQFEQASSEGARYLRGTLSNGLSFARNRDFLIANFGTDCLGVMKRRGPRMYLPTLLTVSRSRKQILCSAICGTGFGVPDLRTAYIGSLKGKRIPYFQAPVPGLPMLHRNDGK